ncbi:MAG: thiamine pyrophosphate-binding protein, partial [Sedimenticola sp.]
NQHLHYQQRYINCDFINPDFEQLATAFGINYKQVAAEADLESLFSDYDLSGTINLIEVLIDKDAFPNYSSKR